MLSRANPKGRHVKLPCFDYDFSASKSRKAENDSRITGLGWIFQKTFFGLNYFLSHNFNPFTHPTSTMFSQSAKIAKTIGVRNMSAGAKVWIDKVRPHNPILQTRKEWCGLVQMISVVTSWKNHSTPISKHHPQR